MQGPSGGSSAQDEVAHHQNKKQGPLKNQDG